MNTSRLADHYFHLGEVGILEENLTPAYKLYEHEAEPGEEDGPETAHLDVVHNHANTWALNAAANSAEMQAFREQSQSRVIGINGPVWFVTTFAGPPAFIHALAAKAEALGAKRIPN